MWKKGGIVKVVATIKGSKYKRTTELEKKGNETIDYLL
jgi:hypothetical protein